MGQETEIAQTVQCGQKRKLKKVFLENNVIPCTKSFEVKKKKKSLKSRVLSSSFISGHEF